MSIKFYKINDPYGSFSNFKKARMFLWGRWWNNTETPYQAAKCIDNAEREKIYNAKTPREAREIGQTVKMRPDWDSLDPKHDPFYEYKVKDRVMYECVLAKFVQHPNLRAELMSTGSETIIEDSPYDAYWGCGPDGSGKNMLGQILMRVRDELKGE